METNANTLNWFEIPAIDIERAKGFYQGILNIEMPTNNMMGVEMAFFPFYPGSGKLTGAICKSDRHKPSYDGCIVYLNCNPDLQKALDKVEQGGGQVVMPKTRITDEIGYMAFIIDTEGNKVALHSQQ